MPRGHRLLGVEVEVVGPFRVRELLLDLAPLRGLEFRLLFLGQLVSGPTLGNFELGALASLTSVRTSVVSGGVMCVAGTVVLVALLPAFWRYDARKLVDA